MLNPINLRKTTTSPSSGNRSNYNPLFVFCYFVGFWQKRLETFEDAFRFPPFDGEVEVTSLEAYPLRYYRRNTAIGVEDFVARGLNFLDLMVIRHRKYDGLTVSEKAEEVRSLSAISDNMKLRLSRSTAMLSSTMR